MNVLVFKTDIKTAERLQAVSPLLNNHPTVTGWSIDTEDIDNVLRIEHSGLLNETDVIQLMSTYGFTCQLLPD